MRRRWNRWRHAQASRLRFVTAFDRTVRLNAAGPAPARKLRGHGFFTGGGF